MLDNVVRRHFKYQQAFAQKLYFPCDVARRHKAEEFVRGGKKFSQLFSCQCGEKKLVSIVSVDFLKFVWKPFEDTKGNTTLPNQS